jgi:hypothetical protein
MSSMDLLREKMYFKPLRENFLVIGEMYFYVARILSR